MSSEVSKSKWLEEAIRKCKEGDEHACEIVRRYIDYLMHTCLKIRTEMSLSLLLALLSTLISLILRLSIMKSLGIISVFTVPILYLWYLYWSSSKLLEYLCSKYIDPPMFTREAKIYGLMILTTIIACIIVLILATIFK